MLRVVCVYVFFGALVLHLPCISGNQEAFLPLSSTLAADYASLVLSPDHWNIHLEAGQYEGCDGFDMNQNGALSVNFIGTNDLGGTVLACGNSAMVQPFRWNSGQGSLQNMTLANATATLVFSEEGVVSLINVHFDNCGMSCESSSATTCARVIEIDSGGSLTMVGGSATNVPAFIRMVNCPISTLTITGGVWSNLQTLAVNASYVGGVTLDGLTLLYSSGFVRASVISPNNVVLRDCFVYNSTSNFGGLVKLVSGSLEMSGCSVSGFRGGYGLQFLVSLQGPGDVSIIDTSFTLCEVTNSLFNMQSLATATLSNCTFTQMKGTSLIEANVGMLSVLNSFLGWIRCLDLLMGTHANTELVVDRCSFLDCDVNAMSIQGPATVTNLTMAGGMDMQWSFGGYTQLAHLSINSDSYWGFFRVTMPGGGTVMNCSFVGSSFYENGGAVAGQNLEVTDCLFENVFDSYASPVDMNGVIRRCLFLRTGVTTNSGGALIMRSGNIEDSFFVGTYSIFDTGAIIIEGGVNVTNSSFFQCSCQYSGGAISVTPSSIAIISNCVFDSNSASEEGGAIYNRGVLHLRNSTFVNNGAGSVGGAICNEFDFQASEVSDCSFVANSASRGGAIFYNFSPLQPMLISVVRSTLSYNQASEDGGAIFAGGENGLSLINSTLSFNGGDGFGAAVTYLGTTSGLEVSGCELVGNVPGTLLVFGGRYVNVSSSSVESELYPALAFVSVKALLDSTSVLTNTSWAVACVSGQLALQNSVAYSESNVALLSFCPLDVSSSTVGGLRSALATTSAGMSLSSSSLFGGAVALVCAGPISVSSDTLICGGSPNGIGFYDFYGRGAGCVVTEVTERSSQLVSCYDHCATANRCVESAGLYVASQGCPLCGGPCDPLGGTYNPCPVQARCVDAPPFGSYECLCRTGYVPDGLGGCEDFDECADGLVDCPLEFSSCVNSGGSFSCECDPGFSMSLFPPSCDEINECSVAGGMELCGARNATCLDLFGSFTCECLEGFYLDNNGSSSANESVADGSCRACPAGTTTNGTGAISSSACGCIEGFYSGTLSNNNSSSSGGGGGSGSSEVPSLECIACPDHSTTMEIGATSVAACVCDDSQLKLIVPSEECGTCGPGFVLGSPLTACERCPANTFSSGTNSLACMPCPAHSETSSSGGAATCTCVLYYAPSEYDSGGALAACTPACPPGRFAPLTGVCLPCPAGSYSEITNAVECSSCPIQFSLTPTNSSTSRADCVCLPGYTPLYNDDGDLVSCLASCPPGQLPVGGFCVPCPPDTYWNETAQETAGCEPCPSYSTTNGASGATTVTDCSCLPGFEVDGGDSACRVQCEPGSRRVSDSSCTLCGSNSYSGERNVDSCEACPAHAVSPVGSTAVTNCTCAAGFYYYHNDYYHDSRRGGEGAEGGSGTFECVPCPVGGVCEGGQSPPVAAPGYYSDGEGEGGSQSFVACVPAEACAGGGECGVGYQDGELLCAECQHGFYRLNGRCVQCQAALSALGVGFLVLVLALSWVALWANDSGGLLRSQTAVRRGGAFAIALNSVQLVVLAGGLNVGWPPGVQGLFDSMSILTFNFELGAIECYRESGSQTHPYLLRWLVAVFSPVYVLIGLCLAGGLRVLVGARSAATALSPLSESIAFTFAQALLIMYTPLTALVLGPLDCVESGRSGLRVVASSRDLVCFSSSAHSTLLGLALLFAALYIVGIPTALVVGFWHLKRKMSEADFAWRLPTVTRYRGDRFWYEGVVLVRKAAVVVVLTFTAASPYMSAAAASALLLAFFVVHHKLKPYVERWHNILEAACTLCAILIFQSGSMYIDNEVGTGAQAVVIAVLLACSLGGVAVGIGLDVWRLYAEWRGVAASPAHEFETTKDSQDVYSLGEVSLESLVTNTTTDRQVGSVLKSGQRDEGVWLATPSSTTSKGGDLPLRTPNSVLSSDVSSTSLEDMITVVLPPPPPLVALPGSSSDFDRFPSIQRVPLPPPLSFPSSSSTDFPSIVKVHPPPPLPRELSLSVSDK